MLCHLVDKCTVGWVCEVLYSGETMNAVMIDIKWSQF